MTKPETLCQTRNTKTLTCQGEAQLQLHHDTVPTATHRLLTEPQGVANTLGNANTVAQDPHPSSSPATPCTALTYTPREPGTRLPTNYSDAHHYSTHSPRTCPSTFRAGSARVARMPRVNMVPRAIDTPALRSNRHASGQRRDTPQQTASERTGDEVTSGDLGPALHDKSKPLLQAIL